MKNASGNELTDRGFTLRRTSFPAALPWEPKRLSSPWRATKRAIAARYGHIRWRVMDLTCIGYTALIGALLVFFHRHVPDWPKHIGLHLLLVIGFLEVVRAGERTPRRSWLWVLRTFYPVVLLLYGWKELGTLQLMFCGDFWGTEKVTALDKLLFGVHPTVWVQRLYRPWLDELIKVFYFGYYLFLPVVTFTLYLKKKREAALAAFSIITCTYLVNFVLFYLFPVVNPGTVPEIQALSTRAHSGYIVSNILQQVIARGYIPGGAFPSSHVSGAFVWALVAARYLKKSGYILFPMAVGVAVATVYLGYHHALDPICGFILGGLCYALGLRWVKSRGEDPLTR
jgi:membrane-associated phospholipid phosphatase